MECSCPEVNAKHMCMCNMAHTDDLHVYTSAIIYRAKSAVLFSSEGSA